MLEQTLNTPITKQIGREIERGIFGKITGKINQDQEVATFLVHK
jgi:hypothetical protein